MFAPSPLDATRGGTAPGHAWHVPRHRSSVVLVGRGRKAVLAKEEEQEPLTAHALPPVCCPTLPSCNPTRTRRQGRVTCVSPTTARQQGRVTHVSLTPGEVEHPRPLDKPGQTWRSHAMHGTASASESAALQITARVAARWLQQGKPWPGGHVMGMPVLITRPLSSDKGTQLVKSRRLCVVRNETLLTVATLLENLVS